MSETHTRGEAEVLHPITGEPPGIKDILERRANEDAVEPQDPPERDPETTAAEELAAWRTRATEAESRATEADRQRQAAEHDRAIAMRATEDTGFTAISTALTATEQSIDTLKTEMKTAGESGDFGRVAEIATELGQRGAELRELQRGKQQFEQTRTDRIARPTQSQPSASSATERTILGRLGAQTRDAFLSTRTPETAAFLRQHPEFFTDDSAFNRISGADTLAKGRGIQVDTPEYFKLIEKEAALSQPTRTQGSRQFAPGAAPSREAPGPSGETRTRGGDVYVSADQKAAAAWMNVDPVEYAREEADLRRRGEMPYRRR